jgi:hypothetical protein
VHVEFELKVSSTKTPSLALGVFSFACCLIGVRGVGEADA